MRNPATARKTSDEGVHWDYARPFTISILSMDEIVATRWTRIPSPPLPRGRRFNDEHSQILLVLVPPTGTA
eukprot:scaffold518760_cov19-Prasinocladus_malaysianus.AAC.2